MWKVADKLRGTFKQHEYGSVVLPLLVLRRMDAVLEPTKAEVVEAAEGLVDITPGMDRVLQKKAGQLFYNKSKLTFPALLKDDLNLADNLVKYIAGLSEDAFHIMSAYNFDDKITRMDRAEILYPVVADFADLDLRPSVVSNETMGYIFEELLRKFSEMSNETAGEHYTPREVIRLVADLLIGGQTGQKLTDIQVPVRSVYDPAAGTGGMLVVTKDRIRQLNPNARVKVYGQEINDETWAIAQSELMMQGIGPEQMHNGNTLTGDAFPDKKFDFILANPPYGVNWKAYAQPIKDEAAHLGMAGRFGAGLPRVSDGSLLFLQHMLSHMAPVTETNPQGSRVGIVLSGSPLFSGQAGSGESEIRRWILENDWLEGIVALPDQMFYNTGISTYVWILTNAKTDEQRGVVKLVDAREMGTKMRKSLGDKRKELTNDAIDEIVQLFGGALDEFAEDSRVKVLPRETFGFQRVTVERPLHRRWQVSQEAVQGPDFAQFASLVGRQFATEKELLAEVSALSPAKRKKFMAACAIPDPDAPVTLKKGKPVPDVDLRDQENIPLPDGWFDLDDDERKRVLLESAEAHLENEIKPYVPDAWIDHSRTKLGFEIPFTRQFYVYEPPRPVEEIAAEIKELESQIQEWMKGLEL
ncbi:class I SAM-dependent DNA methyltransferase [Cutibacterium granulosum]|uniref:type I restriction-modification system subunit M n=2 Tax=Cutibacterium granulosum TaxID=33011 RepID=UPI002B22F6A8|nr:class I SAM-dependent DNA methyltransferase [Cutibacterium granulosum]